MATGLTSQGTAEANYDIGPPDQFTRAPPLVSVGSVTVGLSKIVNLGMTFVPGRKDIPVALHDMRPAEERILAAKDWTVLFYETSARQAWLLDGPSGLLHICRAWLDSGDAKDLFNNLGPTVDPISVFHHAKADGGMSDAVKLLLDAHNRDIKLYHSKHQALVESRVEYPNQQRKVEEKTTASWRTWGDLVEARVLDLEYLYDFQFAERSKRTADIHSPFHQQRMDGYDFQEIVKDKRNFRKWEIHFQSSFGGWLDFVESYNAVPVFGTGFGDLLRSRSTDLSGRRMCLQRTLLPRGHDYLAVSMEVLFNLTGRHLKDGLSHVKLGNSTYWLSPEAVFTPCACSQALCCMPIATLATKVPISVSRSTSLRNLFKEHARGAVIFPCTPNQIKKQMPQKPHSRSLLSRLSFSTRASVNAVDSQMSQHELGLAFRQNEEDTDTGAQREDEHTLNEPPNGKTQTGRKNRNIWNKLPDSVLLLIPPAWRTELCDDDESEIICPPDAAQHLDIVDVSEGEAELGETGSCVSHSDVVAQSDAAQQPRLRKVKATQGLREKAKMTPRQTENVMRLNTLVCSATAVVFLFGWLLWLGAGWLRAWAVTSAMLIVCLSAVVARVM